MTQPGGGWPGRQRFAKLDRPDIREPPLPIRPYRQDDLEACATIYRDARALAFPYMPRSIDAATFVADTAQETVVVHEEGDRVTGFAAVHAPGAFIHHLYVSPDALRAGIGTRLLAVAVQIAGGSASLKCQTANTRGLAFYRHHGWTEDGAGRTDGHPWVLLRSPAGPSSSNSSQGQSKCRSPST